MKNYNATTSLHGYSASEKELLLRRQTGAYILFWWRESKRLWEEVLLYRQIPSVFSNKRPAYKCQSDLMQTFLLDFRKLQHGVSGSLKSMIFSPALIESICHLFPAHCYFIKLKRRRRKGRNPAGLFLFPLCLQKKSLYIRNDKISAIWKGVAFPLSFIYLFIM